MIVIRCDATAAIGGGHVARMVALAEALTDAGQAVTFVADIDVPWLRALVESSWQVESPPQTVAGQVDLFRSLRASVVVIDSYVIDLELATSARAHGIKVAAIADHSSPRYQSDLVVVPALDELEATEFGPDAELVGGIEYALIRSKLRELRQARPPIGERASRIVWVLMGGTDSLGVIAQVATSVDLPTAAEVHLAPVQAGLSGLSKEGTEVVVFGHEPSPDLLADVVGADLVVSAAGVSSFELLYLGLPTALLQVADNQALNFEMLVGNGLALPVTSRPPIDAGSFWREVADLLARDDLESIGARAAVAVDGLGAQRTAAAIERLLG